MMYNLKEKIKKKIDSIMKIIDKIKVPVRPNRHYQRWGREKKIKKEQEKALQKGERMVI